MSKIIFKLFVFVFFIGMGSSCRADETPTAPFTLDYRDWTLACDNVLRCEALTLGDASGLLLKVVRDAGPNGRIQLSLTSAAKSSPADHFYMDDKHIVFENFSWKKKIFPGEVSLFEFSIENEAQATQFIRTISQGSTLSIVEKPTSKKLALSLKGLNESLLLMDQIQGRRNNETALAPAAKGTSARSLVPNAPAAPRINVKPYTYKLGVEASTLINATRKKMRDDRCDADREKYSDAAYALNQQQALVIIECASAAYNISYHVYLASRGKKLPQITTLSLPYIPNTANSDLIFNAAYAPSSSILTQSGKTRGLYDCGNFASWAFDGTQFNLLEYRQFELCKNGVHFDFPRLWHADIFPNYP